jgi:large subunit ribosomal protein L7A
VLELLKKKEKVVGIKQTRKAAEQDRLEAVFIAYDADQRVVGQLKQLCEEKKIDVYTTESMKQLGKAAGIDVGAAIIGVFKS